MSFYALLVPEGFDGVQAGGLNRGIALVAVGLEQNSPAVGIARHVKGGALTPPRVADRPLRRCLRPSPLNR